MIGINRNNLSYGVVAFTTALTLLMVFPEWWNTLLTANGFIPHGHCYLWKPGLVWLHVISDSCIALAYVAISATLAYLVYKARREIPFHWMFLWFGCFIVACGGTHFMDVWTLWHPTYWLSGALKVITAVASVTTATSLPFLVPQALALVEAAKLSEERRAQLETANGQLAALNEQLRTVDQLKTQFFANVSHELRTPLALILGPVEQLLQSTVLSQEQQHSLKMVERNAHLLLKQVNDLLDVSKLEVGKMGVNYQQVDLTQLVRYTATYFDGLAQEKNITFTIDAPKSLPAEVDAAKVQRILLNLLSNAFKFTPEGGYIRCILSNPEVALTAVDSLTLSLLASVEPQTERVNQQVILSVQDSGPGVPVDLRQSIFERFSQGEGGTTRRFGGTGLGLAIVREFVELQNGTIEVGTAPEGGAKFTVQLPLKAPDGFLVTTASTVEWQQPKVANLLVEELRTVQQVAYKQTAPKQTAYPELERSTGKPPEKPLVLVVEDHAEMNQFITAALATEYTTATAANGQEGLEQAIALRPDLILTDMMMPYLDGDQLVQKLRTHPELDMTPIVVLTAKTDADLRVQLLRQGAQDYLMKPFSMEELRARVSNLIAIQRVRNLLQQELASQHHDLEILVEEVSLRRRELQIALNALQRQSEELEQSNRLKDEFLAIVSHELRTPLNAILGWAQALRIRKFDQVTTARALETIERNAKLQTQLIQNLLDVSRLLRGKLLLDQHPTDLCSVIKSALKTVQAEATNKRIRLQSYLDHSVSPVLGDRERLQQVLENLLFNAIKFTPEEGQVEIYLEQQPETATIQIKDTGEGIQASVLPYIFDYFRQADSSTTRKYGGLGLGLSIVQQLVELHNGTVSVESAGEGQGATFTVTLPLMIQNAQITEFN